MIGKALQFTRDTLDQHLKNRFGLDDHAVVLNNLIDGNGTLPLANQNKVVISLINIDKETTKAFYNNRQQQEHGAFAAVNPEDRFNLDILVSSNFDDYAETLKFLTEVMLFFQVNNSLSAQKFSAIPQGLGRLDFEIEKVGYQQMQGLWTAMGAKYQPSVIYKIRMATLQGNEPSGFTPAVTHTLTAAEL